MHTVRTMLTGRRGSAAVALRAAIVTGFGLLVCACQTDQKITAAPDVPYDYRLRHPITSRRPNARCNSSSAPIAASSLRSNAPSCWRSRKIGSRKPPAAC